MSPGSWPARSAWPPGEYVSVSTQRDSEQALLAKERRELVEEPEEELAELADLYVQKGLTEDLALQVAEQLTAHDALGAHAEAELGIDPDELTNPWHAAWASMLAFTVGALLPLLTIGLSPAGVRLWVTGASVVVALALTGWASARLGQSPAGRAVVRNVGGGVHRDGRDLRHRRPGGRPLTYAARAVSRARVRSTHAAPARA